MRKQAAVRQSETLGILMSRDGPMTAYEVIAELQVAEPDIAAPTVYRTLAALTDQGRAHRLESLRAFVPCRCAHADSVPILTICDDCGSVAEHDGGGLPSTLAGLVAASGFTPERHVIELHGRCGTCAA
jgi:Fur family zinc uptake transcriptional regulator